jgi:anti-sigma factor (TIGR02949 family)
MPTMRCNQVRDKLSAFVDHEVSRPLSDQIEEHLSECGECRQVYARLQAVAGLLDHSSTVPPVPEKLAARVLELAARPDSSPRSRDNSLLRRWRRVSVPMRIAAAVVFIVGLSTGALMGHVVGQSATSWATAGPSTTDDPVTAYNLNYLGATQDGSVADAYLTLVADGEPPGD